MRKTSMFAAALMAATVASQAATPAAVNLDGSANPRAAAKGPTLAASASRALQANDVPSRNIGPADLKAEADADMAKRDQRPAAPRLKAERQNLTGSAAAHAIAQRQNPSNYDQTIQMGDKDHTEQDTSLKVYLKK